jgi:raffinose/stachyose/melibiose transport system permease protein
MTSTGTVTEAPARPAARSPGRPRRSWRDSYVPYLLPGLALFTVVIFMPFAVNIGISLTDWPGGIGTPDWIGLDNYDRLLQDSTFWASFRHNVALIVAMAIVPTVIGLLLAYSLFDVIGKRYGPRTASLLRACFYLPQVLPIVVAGIVWSWILRPEDGAANATLDKLGLGSLSQDWLGDPDFALYSVMFIMVWVQIGFPLVVFMGGLQRIDPTLYEAAEIDAASWRQRLWHITIPQIRPEIFVVLLWTTIASLKIIAWIYVLTRGGPGDATNVPAYYAYNNFFITLDVGYGAAIATILTVVLLVLTVVFLRVQRRSESES